MEEEMSRMGVVSIWRKAALLCAIGVGMAFSTAAMAQDWPARALTIVVPFGPGASNDTFTRAIANVLTQSLGKPVVVENRPGAGGFPGVLTVSQGQADGYTFLESPNTIASYGAVQGLDFDAMTDIVPVAMIARSPMSMAIPTTIPPATLEEFITYAKERPGQLFYGTVGQGSLASLLTEQFVHAAGLEMTRVEYKSAGDAILDLVAGRIHVFFNTASSMVGQVDGGQLRIVGYTGPNTSDTTPAAPTFAEAGLDGVTGDAWWGIFAAVGTPPEIVTKMNAAINAALVDPTLGAFLKAAGATVSPMSPDEFTQVIAGEIEMLTRVIDELDIEIAKP
jgi:tripartite-type tricarboxylate transporter receptor subunit TctC